MDVDPEKERAFQELADAVTSGAAKTITYALPYPKYEFLRYLVDSKQVVLHGSNLADLIRLEPRQQTTFLGNSVHAVFATPDDVWCMFYAIVNNNGFVGSKRNACLRVTEPSGRLRKFYWFSLSQPMLQRKEAFCSGVIYILPRETFSPGDVPDEWMSYTAVEPLAKLPVSPGDFPFLAKITGHLDEEPLWRFFWRMIRHRQVGSNV